MSLVFFCLFIFKTNHAQEGKILGDFSNVIFDFRNEPPNFPIEHMFNHSGKYKVSHVQCLGNINDSTFLYVLWQDSSFSILDNHKRKFFQRKLYSPSYYRKMEPTTSLFLEPFGSSKKMTVRVPEVCRIKQNDSLCEGYVWSAIMGRYLTQFAINQDPVVISDYFFLSDTNALYYKNNVYSQTLSRTRLINNWVIYSQVSRDSVFTFNRKGNDNLYATRIEPSSWLIDIPLTGRNQIIPDLPVAIDKFLILRHRFSHSNYLNAHNASIRESDNRIFQYLTINKLKEERLDTMYVGLQRTTYIIDSIEIASDFVYESGFFDLSFSPNNRYLYVTVKNKIYQYDLEDSLNHYGKTLIYEYPENRQFIGIRTMPNRKMWFKADFVDSTDVSSPRYLGCIEYPDKKGEACRVLPEYRLFPYIDDSIHYSLQGYPFQNIVAPDFAYFETDYQCDKVILTNKSDTLFNEFMWYYNNDSFYTTNRNPITISLDSSQYVRLKAFNKASYAWYSDSLRVQHYDRPLIALKLENDSICLEDTMFLNVRVSCNGKPEVEKLSIYFGDKGDTVHLNGDFCNKQIPTRKQFTKSGDYTLSVWHCDGRYLSDAQQIKVHVREVSALNLPDSLLLCEESGEEILLEVPRLLSYLWLPDEDTNSKYLVKRTGNIVFEGKDSYGCQTTHNLEVISGCDYYVHIPTAFTPNGDGLNDNFEIASEGISDFFIQIFDRWGSLIFESHDTHFKWNGIKEQTALPDGLYFYLIRFNGLENKVKKRQVRKGMISLLR